MKPMYFKLYHNPENKTLTIPRAALQLSGLADAEELILHTGGGYVLAARNALSTLECLHLLQFLTSTAASLLLQLAVFSQEGAEFPECEDTLDEEDEMVDPGLTIPACLLELAGLDEADSLEAVAEDGRVIVLCFGTLFGLGAFFLLAGLLRLPTSASTKAVLTVTSRGKSQKGSINAVLFDMAARLSPLVHLDGYKRKKLEAQLKSAEIKMSPETYIAAAWVKAGLIALLIIPALLIFPILAPVIVFLAVAVYFKEQKRADEIVQQRREEIEAELPRFVNTIEQELRASRDVLNILKSYQRNAGHAMKRELEITIADMASGNEENALTRMESRIGSIIYDCGVMQTPTSIFRDADHRLLCGSVLPYEIPVFHKALSECGSLEVRPVAICVPQEIQEYCMELFGEDVQIAAASHDLFAKQVNGQIYRPLVEKYIAGEKRL